LIKFIEEKGYCTFYFPYEVRKFYEATKYEVSKLIKLMGYWAIGLLSYCVIGLLG